MDFTLKFEGENQKRKKRSSSQNLRLLDHVHSICFVVSQKKAFMVPVFGQKFAGSLVLIHKFTLTWGAQAVIWGEDTARNAPPPLCIGVAKIFNWGGTNQKSHAITSSKFFERGTFCGTKISRMEDNGRSEAMAWFGT